MTLAKQHRNPRIVGRDTDDGSLGAVADARSQGARRCDRCDLIGHGAVVMPAVKWVDAPSVVKSLLLEQAQGALRLVAHGLDHGLRLRAEQAHVEVAAGEQVFDELFFLPAEVIRLAIGSSP